jgi:hypothetical protein
VNAPGPRWATAALLGVVAGHFYSLEVGTARVLDGLDDEAYLRFKTAMDARYQRRIGPVWTASLVTGTAAVTVDRRTGRSALPTATSLALNATAFAVLLAVNEPANAEHARVVAGERPAATAAAARRRWNVGQTARTWLVGAAFALALASAGGWEPGAEGTSRALQGPTSARRRGRRRCRAPR